MHLLLALALLAPSETGQLPPAPVRQYTVAWQRILVPGDVLDWQTEEPGGPAIDPQSRTVVVGGRSGALRAYKPDGDERWDFQAGNGWAAPPRILDGVVYAGALDGRLYALDVATGQERWRYDAGEEIGSSPLPVGDLLVFETLQDSTIAVDRKTGAWRWHHRRDQREGFTIRGCASPLLAQGLVIAGYSDGWVSALDPATGAVRWEQKVAPTADFMDVDGLATDGRAVFAASVSGALTALEASTGKTLWERKLPGALRVAAADGLVFVVTTTEILAVSARDGGPRWKRPLDGWPGAPPLKLGPRLVVPNGKGLLLLDPPTGREMRLFSPGTGVTAQPAALDRRAYVLTGGGVIMALDFE